MIETGTIECGNIPTASAPASGDATTAACRASKCIIRALASVNCDSTAVETKSKIQSRARPSVCNPAKSDSPCVR